MGLGGMMRAVSGRFGYRFDRISVQRFGIDPMVDIERLASRFAMPVRSVFDVGANVGQTAIACRAAFPDARITCFEPVPETFAALQTAIAPLGRVSAHNIALSDRSGEARIRTYDSSLVASLEADAPFTKGRAASEASVELDTLDHFCAREGIAHIDLLKIDTEGHDIAVLRGGEEMLATGRIGFVLTEFNRLSGDDAPGSLARTDALLSAHGYHFVGSYIDEVVVRDTPFVVGNALFVRPVKGVL